ncbi:MAG: antibiotic biosynthesis monooxygenase [Sphingobacteriales bacterium]|nr:antibiotic biosynthesis monooxygenase [Sphingobacteriales bacterium]MBI3717103.1 antibiotic biosynthesis monooxygenase [Sphingobacteriales bacterium]
MITEIALLNIIPGKAQEFEKAFGEAQEIISSMKGYIEHELQKCMEEENKYLLLVRWETIEDHTEGFRKHERYKEWKNLLHHFYHPFPVVEHYKTIY